MFKYIFIFLFSFGIAFADVSFKDKLKTSQKGDFVVYEFNKLYSLLSIFDIDDDKIILEEVSIPKNNFKDSSFLDWINKGFLGSTSHMLYEIDLNKNKIIDAYSISRNAWIDLSKESSFLIKLLSLDLKRIKDSERKKIGPKINGEVDRRMVWNPKMFKNNQIIKKPSFDVFKTLWPDDGSDFSNKEFFIYFDKNNNNFSLPYFIEISTNGLSFMIKNMDSGNNLKSKISKFPKRAPQIIDILDNKDSILIKIKSWENFNKFYLYAIDVTGYEKDILNIANTSYQDDGFTFLKIQKDNLNTIFKKDNKYKWVAQPYENREILIEKKDLFVWK
ncbi:MAG: hypothetical protein JXA94_05405 [Parachlamydiales bacterium]|nr:hypothetical protein [Parachlamydiales bacterium]